MKQYYIATLEIVVDDEDADYSQPLFNPITEKIFNNEMDIIGLIHLTHERQKPRPSYKVMEGTLKKHARDLYDDVILEKWRKKEEKDGYEYY